jgi:hypothetical protein
MAPTTSETSRSKTQEYTATTGEIKARPIDRRKITGAARNKIVWYVTSCGFISSSISLSVCARVEYIHRAASNA